MPQATVTAETPTRLLPAVTDPFRELVDSVSEHALFLLDSAGRIASWNVGAVRLTGYLAEEAIGCSWSILCGRPKGANGSLDGLPFALSKERSEGEQTLVRKDGTTVRAAVTVTPLHHGGYAVAIREVRACAGANWDLTRTADLLRAVATETTDAMFVKDRDGRYLLFNEAAARFVGKTVAEVLGRDDRALFDEESARRVMERDRCVMESGEVDTAEEALTAAGVSRTFLATKAPYRDAAGNVIGLIGISRDITDRKRAEENLRSSEAVLAQAERLAHLGGWAIEVQCPDDLNANPLRWSEEVYRIFGYEPGAVEPSNALFFEHVHPDDRAQIANAVRRAIAERQSYEIEHRIIRADGAERTVYEHAEITFAPDGKPTRMIGTVQDVTDRKRIEQALRESEGRYRSLVESSADGIFVNKGGQIVYANPALLRMLGADSPQQILGKSPFDFIHPDDHAIVRERMRTTFKDRQAVPFIEEKYLRLDGTIVEVEIAATPFEDQGEVAVLVTSRDLTQRKRVEEALRRKQEFVRLVLDTDPNLIFVKDADGRFVLANKALANLYGTTPEDLVGRKPGVDLPAPSEFAEYRRVEEEVLRSGQPAETDETNTRPDGRVRWFRTIKSPLKLSDGTTHVLGIASDITERKRAEEALRERENLLRNVIANIPCAVFWKDRNSVYLGCNDQVAANHGLASPDQLIGRTDYDLGVAAGEAEFYRECDRRVIETGEPILNLEETQTRPGGTRILLTSKVPMRDEAGTVTGVLGVYQDITDRKKLEDQFRQAQKLEAIGRLAGGVAHDFNNILTVINCYSDILTDSLPRGEPAWESAAMIRDAGERAAALTAQLLAFSRKAIIEPKVLDLNDVVSQSAKLLFRLIGEDITLVTVLAPGLARVRVDPGQIEQTVMNLAVNARDAMPSGGKLTIETMPVTVRHEDAAFYHDLTPGEYVQLAMCDTGCGMTEEVRASIFEPFFTTKEAGRGTGLGLAVVHGVVKTYGGYIGVDSAVGLGTTFKILLPAVVEEVTKPLSTEATGAPRPTETVLLVEDEVGVRKIVKLALEMQGYTVLAADGGTEALRIAGSHEGPVHLLVTDVVMPGMGGRAVAQALRSSHPGLKVLFVSGYTDDAVVRHGIVDGVDAFLQKPFTPLSLAQKVREVLECQAQSAPSLEA